MCYFGALTFSFEFIINFPFHKYVGIYNIAQLNLELSYGVLKCLKPEIPIDRHTTYFHGLGSSVNYVNSFLISVLHLSPQLSFYMLCLFGIVQNFISIFTLKMVYKN